MRTTTTCLVALAALAGCSKSGSLVFVTVDSAAPIADAARMHVALAAGGQSHTSDVTLTPATFPPAHSFAVDVSQEREVERWLDEVVARHGGLDHLVDCAGISGRLTIPQMTVEQWRRVIDVNLTGAFVLLKLSQPHLAQRGGGSITVISSVAADHIAYLGGVHYAASKTALTGLVRHAAFEMGRQNIRVNAVGPGPMRNAMGGRERSLEDRQAAARNVPLQQVVEPQDIAEACAFLASPAARMVTGVYLPVDGGFLTGRGVNYRRYFELHGEAF